MTYLEAIGHMVVVNDKNTGKTSNSSRPEDTYFRNEEIGSLLRGKSFLEKRSDGKQRSVPSDRKKNGRTV